MKAGQLFLGKNNNNKSFVPKGFSSVVALMKMDYSNH
jgi:hypothetical protein